ncbi:MAG: T9SS type A sorting domain-containing protein [Bacteroidota bacterium]|nr:T9SS type A sorting domain-containing protein [Bacteroidota bacterium]MDX5430873.1 T9SS type A sorting domain-containing protein [Bacteroidota bacterium]MDX5469618.1 T9SS type A sorting domain-containing protein [Bacteroidota bacterium]
MKRKIYLFGCLLAASFAFGQQSHDHPSCGGDEYYQHQIQQDPTILNRSAEFEADYQEFLPIFKAKQNKGPEKFIIPVVFHVFHAGGPENISLAQIQDQSDTMNRAFNGVKFERTRELFWGVGADCEIEFRLAKLDPNGKCTEGVVRIYDPETENATDNIKLKSAWPTDRYFNVWVVKDINRAFQSFGTVLGYAQFPWSGGAQTDGVVIRHDNVGSIGTAANPIVGVPQWGSTLIHEAGHWLGLYHPFQDSCFGGDQVDDTPPVEAPNFGCNYNVNSCNNDNPDLPDMVENYMDYANGSCMGLFTLGQKARMHGTLRNWRKKLWQPSNLVATGTADPYTVGSTCVPKAYFYATETSLCESGTITFRNNSYNSSGPMTYEWSFPGGNPSTSTSANPNVSYPSSGMYDVTLIAKNAQGSDTFTRKEYVEVYGNLGQYGAGLEEGFEFETFPVNNWAVYSTSAVNFARVGTGEGSIGGAYAAYVRNSSVEAGAKFFLESPSLDLSAISNPKVSFYYAAAQRRTTGGGSTSDALSIQTSTDCGKTWTQRSFIPGNQLATTGGSSPFTAISFTPAGPHQWKKVDVDLSAVPSGSRNNMKVRFEFRSNGGHNFYIDNINLGFSTGIADFTNENNFTVYPNPSAGSTNIRVNLPEGENAKIEILDLYGRTVEVVSDEIQQGGEQIFTFTPNNLSNGMYLVQLTVNGQSFTRKLMLVGAE